MIMYCDVVLKAGNNKHLYLDVVDISHPELGDISILYDETSSSKIDEFTRAYRMKGVSFLYTDEEGNEVETNGNSRMDIVKASKLIEVVLVDVDNYKLVYGEDFTFANDVILFQDGEESFELSTTSLD